MDKIINHLKNNFAIYIVLLTCIVIVLIALFITHEPKIEKVDTSMFRVINLEQALDLFETPEPKLLVMSVETCQATVSYVPYLQIAQAKQGYNTYYLELSEIDSKSEEFKEFQEKLDMEYDFRGTKGKFGTFIENTPSTIIIKNKKMVYGYIGSLNTTTLETLTDAYGLSTK